MAGADVVELRRRGDAWTLAVARFGETFSTVTGRIAGDAEVRVALLGDAVATCRDVRVLRPAPEGFTPYRDYVGSALEILEPHTGELSLVHWAREPFEAPNWTPDDAALILNLNNGGPQGGRLIRYDLASGAVRPIDTGFGIRNNNDHVLSFDGTRLGISHHDAAHDGQSAIYTLPATGGTPRLVTPRFPSYLHGWSPDGKWLVYTAGRGGRWNICKIPSDGGEEVPLTDTAGLNDGPEYSPDGAWIYFNSTRTGRMQLWRMRPDGTSPEAVTDDAFNNWFPHVSPDGKWIAFLSYGDDVAPTDHPYYKHVYLRLMPASGGPARVIAYVYGGQGTINVPSWSPDSRRLAFVSNGAIA